MTAWGRHCETEPDLYFSEVDDGRTELGRYEREDMACRLCFYCPDRIKCLEKALVQGEDYGVWGAMGEGERRKFKNHIEDEGYRRGEIPTLDELRASLNAFYRENPSPAYRAAVAQGALHVRVTVVAS